MCEFFILTLYNPSLLKPRSRIYDAFDTSYSLPGVKAGYYNYPVLPWFPGRSMDGWPPASYCSRPQLCSGSHLQLLSLP